MTHLPRLALATPATGPEPSLASLAWLAGMTDRRERVQHFRSRACPYGTEAVGQVTGLPGRHLDSWLMPDDVCRRLFERGARRADLSLVEGSLDEEDETIEGAPHDRPGTLRPIAEALNLPIVAVLPCQPWDSVHLPSLAEGVDAILLDGLEDPNDFDAYRRLVTLALRKPVIGAVEAFPGIRAALREAPRDRPLPDDIFRYLGASFLRFADLPAIHSLARSRAFRTAAAAPVPAPHRRPPFRVAYAQDAAFGSYFPDTLEALELLGAELVEFSPLRDESLPDAADLVMIGCGFPDKYAEALAENVSLISALRSHVCLGQRIYTEGGGTAYLSQAMILDDGRVIPGAGILPFIAELLPQPTPPAPVSRILSRDGWLGPKGAEVRGYKSGRWRVRSGVDAFDCPSCFGTLTGHGDIAFRHHAIGSLIHLHLGALPEVVAAFAGPHRPSLSLPSTRC